MKKFGIGYYAIHCDGTKRDKILFYLKAAPKIFFDLPKYSIIHVHTASRWSYRRFLPILFFAKLFKRKTVIHLHGGQFDQYFSQASTVERFLIQYSFAIADKVVMLSSGALKKNSIFCDPQKAVVIPNGLLFRNFKFENHHQNRRPPYMILFMGDITARNLLKAVKILIEENPDITAVLCGQGELDKVKRILLETHLADFVRLPGWIDGTAKEDLFSHAFVFVLPSYFEILPVSIIEALAHGLPVVSTRIGGIPDAVTDGEQGFLIDPGDVGSLVNAIKTLINDGALWNRMRKSARKKFEENFSIEIINRLLNDLYQSLV